MNRKILIIVENLPVPFDTRVWQEATTLVENGYTVSVICPKGKGYEKEYEEKMMDYDAYILENLVFIEEILHQFCDKGGLKPGIYTCLDYNRQWDYKPFK